MGNKMQLLFFPAAALSKRDAIQQRQQGALMQVNKVSVCV